MVVAYMTARQHKVVLKGTCIQAMLVSRWVSMKLRLILCLISTRWVMRKGSRKYAFTIWGMHAKKVINVIFCIRIRRTKCPFASSSNRMGFAINKRIVFTGTPNLKMVLQPKSLSHVHITNVAFANLVRINAFMGMKSNRRYAQTICLASVLKVQTVYLLMLSILLHLRNCLWWYWLIFQLKKIG